MSGTGIKGNQIADGTVQGVDIDWDPSLTMKGHIIPDTNAAYDLGNAEYKIRHLFLSDNSLWIGDDHKVDVAADGKKRSRKRKKTTIPKSLLTLRTANAHGGNDLSAAVTSAGLDPTLEANQVATIVGEILALTGASTIGDVTLMQMLQYAQPLDGQAAASIEDLYNPNEMDDWEEVVEEGVAHAVVLVSPGGNMFQLTVDDIGNLSTTSVSTP